MHLLASEEPLPQCDPPGHPAKRLSILHIVTDDLGSNDLGYVNPHTISPKDVVFNGVRPMRPITLLFEAHGGNSRLTAAPRRPGIAAGSQAKRDRSAERHDARCSDHL